ncbi:hypothetical protein AMECASPLE_004366 [Ameca splendens]|uniref:Uncharacterized protein n=1 Tax=Ameca splendens TaxID=208324 RepID=A0ABV0ZVH7_9TELE
MNMSASLLEGDPPIFCLCLYVLGTHLFTRFHSQTHSVLTSGQAGGQRTGLAGSLLRSLDRQMGGTDEELFMSAEIARSLGGLQGAPLSDRSRPDGGSSKWGLNTQHSLE